MKMSIFNLLHENQTQISNSFQPIVNIVFVNCTICKFSLYLGFTTICCYVNKLIKLSYLLGYVSTGYILGRKKTSILGKDGILLCF